MEIFGKSVTIFVLLLLASALIYFVMNTIDPIDKSKIKPTPPPFPRLSDDQMEKVVELFRQMIDDGLFDKKPCPETYMFDVKLLPHPKLWIESSFLRAHAEADGWRDRRYYETALRCLASFQDGVGQEPIRLPPGAGAAPEPERWPSDEVRTRAYEIGVRVEAERRRALNLS